VEALGYMGHQFPTYINADQQREKLKKKRKEIVGDCAQNPLPMWFLIEDRIFHFQMASY